jgi:hypothetical protein
MGFQCKAGHDSDESDYCSVCGAPIGRGSAPPPLPALKSPHAAPGASGACPSCGEPRADVDARFCEVCRYDFVARKAGPPPVAKGTPAAPAPAPIQPSPGPSPGPAALASTRWFLVVGVDASLDTDPDPASPCPKDVGDRIVAIDRPELRVGRHDDRRDIHPEISLHDPGASRRHAKFVVLADGQIALQDLAAMNGTSLNGVDVVSGARRTLKEGDVVTLGRWTRIRLEKRSG